MDRVDVPEGEAVLRVGARDLELLRSAMREANEALDDWEYETRMGCTREELSELAVQLRGVEVSLSRAPD